MNAAETKHVVLGLIFLKYISDDSDELCQQLKTKEAEGYDPESIVRLLVEMLELSSGRIYDGCCGSSGMFVQSEKFIESHGGRRDDVAKGVIKAKRRGEALGLSEGEVAFYDALETNDAAVRVLGDEVLKKIALDLYNNFRENATIEGNLRNLRKAD